MRRLVSTAVLAVCALAAAGCGDDDSGAGGNGGGGLYGGGGGGGSAEDGSAGRDGAAGGDGSAGTMLRLAADPGGSPAFDRSSLRARPGRVTIAFDNPSDVPHAVEVEGNGVEEETETVTGSSARLTLDLEPGKYRFYCPVGNHEQAGMAGTLTVR